MAAVYKFIHTKMYNIRPHMAYLSSDRYLIPPVLGPTSTARNSGGFASAWEGRHFFPTGLRG